MRYESRKGEVLTTYMKCVQIWKLEDDYLEFGTVLSFIIIILILRFKKYLRKEAFNIINFVRL